MTKKKITRVEASGDVEMPKTDKTFKPSEENKKKASTNRFIALGLWAVAIGLEIFGILQLKKPEINIVLLVVVLVFMAILSISGSLLWKKANRLDPASEKDKFRFFVQNQLGLIISIVAFLPLIILVLSNEELEGKDKGIVTGVAVVALAITAFFGIDFNPVSIEKYTEEIALAESLSGDKYEVYWTEHGKVYHLYEDCQHINRADTVGINAGTIPAAYEHKNITEMCKTCEKRAKKEIALKEQSNDNSLEDTDDNETKGN